MSGAVSEGAGAAWAALTGAAPPQGWQVRAHETRFGQPELRFMRGDDWLAAAVLSDGWVLFYLRRPAFRDWLDAAATAARFPAARQDRGEFKLRLLDAAQARDALDWLLQPM